MPAPEPSGAAPTAARPEARRSACRHAELVGLLLLLRLLSGGPSGRAAAAHLARGGTRLNISVRMSSGTLTALDSLCDPLAMIHRS